MTPPFPSIAGLGLENSLLGGSAAAADQIRKMGAANMRWGEDSKSIRQQKGCMTQKLLVVCVQSMQGMQLQRTHEISLLLTPKNSSNYVQVKTYICNHVARTIPHMQRLSDHVHPRFD